jgi:hypothetical protein
VNEASSRPGVVSYSSVTSEIEDTDEPWYTSNEESVTCRHRFTASMRRRMPFHNPSIIATRALVTRALASSHVLLAAYNVESPCSRSDWYGYESTWSHEVHVNANKRKCKHVQTEDCKERIVQMLLESHA